MKTFLYRLDFRKQNDLSQTFLLADIIIIYHNQLCSWSIIYHNLAKRFPVFVSNRLAQIEDRSTSSQWRFVPSSNNPADDGTRSFSSAVNRWLTGPSFLQEPESLWSQPPHSLIDLPAEFARGYWSSDSWRGAPSRDDCYCCCSEKGLSKGLQKTWRFLDVMKEDMGEVGAKETDVKDRKVWRMIIRCGHPWLKGKAERKRRRIQFFSWKLCWWWWWWQYND